MKLHGPHAEVCFHLLSPLPRSSVQPELQPTQPLGHFRGDHTQQIGWQLGWKLQLGCASNP
jgi:hypothetical protein